MSVVHQRICAGAWQAPSLKFYLDIRFACVSTTRTTGRADSRRCPRISQEPSFPKSHKRR
ncbi:hypothetical protein EMIT0194P_40350 [Pseudomonas serbica]